MWLAESNRKQPAVSQRNPPCHLLRHGNSKRTTSWSTTSSKLLRALRDIHSVHAFSCINHHTSALVKEPYAVVEPEGSRGRPVLRGSWDRRNDDPTTSEESRIITIPHSLSSCSVAILHETGFGDPNSAAKRTRIPAATGPAPDYNSTPQRASVNGYPPEKAAPGDGPCGDAEAAITDC